MKCSFKTMMYVAGAIFAAAGLAYFSFEGARAAVLASLPFLLFLACPISMLLMMKFMHSAGKNEHAAATPDTQRPAQAASLSSEPKKDALAGAGR